mgnify:CR=1 FL=1
MAEIKNGVVTQVMAGGAQAVIRPYGQGSTVTPPLPVQTLKIRIPAFEAHGEQHSEQEIVQLHPVLAVGDVVAFALFEDGTGLIIDKTGGGMSG